jgi:RNA polymerase sigma-70 factor (ECF subfamily)
MTDIAERVYRSVLGVRCQAGDRAAFEELVELNQPRLRYFLARMAGGDHAADDLLQEVWFDVFRGVARLADPGAFPAILTSPGTRPKASLPSCWPALRQPIPRCHYP